MRWDFVRSQWKTLTGETTEGDAQKWRKVHWRVRTNRRRKFEEIRYLDQGGLKKVVRDDPGRKTKEHLSKYNNLFLVVPFGETKRPVQDGDTQVPLIVNKDTGGHFCPNLQNRDLSIPNESDRCGPETPTVSTDTRVHSLLGNGLVSRDPFQPYLL